MLTDNEHDSREHETKTIHCCTLTFVSCTLDVNVGLDASGCFCGSPSVETLVAGRGIPWAFLLRRDRLDLLQVERDAVAGRTGVRAFLSRARRLFDLVRLLSLEMSVQTAAVTRRFVYGNRWTYERTRLLLLLLLLLLSSPCCRCSTGCSLACGPCSEKSRRTRRNAGLRSINV